MKYVAWKTVHTTGEVFVEAKKIKDNEIYGIIEAKDKAHAEELLLNDLRCSVCGSDNTHIEDIVVSDTKQKLGETLVCNNCKAGKRDKE